MTDTKKHWTKTIVSTIQAVSAAPPLSLFVSSPPPKAYDHRSLKESRPVSSQDFATREKVWELTAASARQIAIEGIHPVPLALPAARVRIPAPATLLARLKTLVAIDAPSSRSATALDAAASGFGTDDDDRVGFGLTVLLPAPPPPRSERTTSSRLLREDSKGCRVQECCCRCRGKTGKVVEGFPAAATAVAATRQAAAVPFRRKPAAPARLVR
mmetsp:Transcript_17227/g.39811  ORF Transcript_17227/g.39811 Transcript_17227/m.39811 type:complete len:214 (+) Transcript_17227:1267-1908(+)